MSGKLPYEGNSTVSEKSLMLEDTKRKRKRIKCVCVVYYNGTQYTTSNSIL